MKINRYAYLIYPVLAAFCIAWAVTGWLSMRSAADFSLAGAVSVKKSAAKVKLPDYAMILKKNIFNAEVSDQQIVQSSAPGAVHTASPAESGFDGKLMGVLSGDGESMAVVSYKGKVYVLKQDEEQDGLALDDVGYFYAVISKGGQRYKLILKTDDKPGGAPVSSGPVKMNSESASTLKSKISRKDVVEKLSDVNSVIKSVLIVPYERDGQFEGYRVRRMTNTSVLRQIGVEINDVIMRLNGKSLETPVVFFDALKNAENLSSVTLDIMRKGEKMTLYVEIEG